MEPKVCISIANWNGKEILDDCLTSLFKVTAYDNFEVVVIDNGSNDGSVELLNEKYDNVRLIQNDENRGFAKANNQGFETAEEIDANYVLMLNNDIKITDPNWLTKMVETAETNPRLGVVGCKVVEPDGNIHYDGRYFPLEESFYPKIGARYQYNRYQIEHKPAEFRYVDDVVGAVYLIKATVIENVGYLDEGYSPAYYEESDYSIRVWDSGYWIGYVSDTDVLHLRRQTSEKFEDIWLTHLMQRNHMRFILINYPLSWVLIGSPFLLARSVDFFFERDGWDIQFRDGLKTNPAKALYYLLATYVFVLMNLPDIYRKRSSRRTVKEILK